MKLFGIDTEAQESTTGAGDRLERPWTVFIFGVLLSVAFTVVVFVRATGTRVVEDKMSVGMLAFAGLATLLSAAYAFIGARYSLKRAKRIVGTIGLLVLLGGVAVLLYMLLAMAP
jgi:hypothetical protein